MDLVKINILQWNSQSAKPKQVELEQFLCSESIHIAALCETWLNCEIDFKINGYNVFRQDRLDSYGGVAILVHKSVKAHMVPFNLTNPGIEIVCIKIYNCLHIQYLMSVYCPPSIRTSLGDWNEVFSFKTNKTLILGDFNGHHPSWSCKTDLTGNTIFDSLIENNFVSLNDGRVTRFKYVNGILQESSPDISTASSDIALCFDWNVTNETLGSDHLLIKIRTSYSNINPQCSKKRNFKEAKWVDFNNSVKFSLSNNYPICDDLQKSYDSFLNVINEAADVNIPLYKISHDPSQHFKPKNYWNAELSRAVGERRLALTIFRRNPTPDNLDKLKDKIRNSQLLIRRAKRKSFTNFCSSIDESTTVPEMWRKMKWLKGYKSPTSHIDESKANKLLRNLTPDSVCPKYPVFSSCGTHNKLESPFLLCELKRCIKSKDTSPGVDSISYSMIKNLPEIGFNILLRLFNQFYSCGFVPHQWREIRIIPIPKPGRDSSSVSAFRPISLMSCLCKIFHSMITKRLEWFMENGDFFYEETTGFRKTKSCIDNLTNLITRIQLGFSKDQITLGCFVDIQDAYNNVDVTVLLSTLNELGVGSKICTYLWSFLKERHLSIQIDNNVISRSTGRGLAQGDPLSPLLFNIVTYKICKKINNVNISQYADDYALYITHKNPGNASNELQIALTHLCKMLNDLGLTISPSKSKICIFKKGINRNPIAINLHDNPIEVVGAVKYLGMWLDRSLKWNKHIAELLDKITKYLNIFKILAGSGWGVHPKHLRRLYIAIIRSRLDYGSFLFNNCSKHLTYKLDKIQNLSLRVIGGFIKTTPIYAMESELCLPPLRVRRTYLAGKFMLKAKSRENNITNHLLGQLSQCQDSRYWRNKSKPLILLSYSYLADTRIYACRRLEVFAMSTWVSSVDLDNVICCNIPNLDKPKRDFTCYNLKSICQDFINQQYSIFYKIFTDGSKDTVGIGAAFLDPQCNLSQKFKITSLNMCIMEAELIAISEALSYAMSLDVNNIVIFTDSRSALQHVVRCTTGIRGTPIAYTVLTTILDLISTSRSVILQWIPSHCGIEHNERVDLLARQATSEGVDYHILPYYADCIYLIRRQCYDLWKEYFDLRSKEIGIWYKTVQPQPLRIPWINDNEMSRKDIVVILRLRTGHIPSNKFAYLMGKVPSPNCDLCGVLEDVLHVLMECVQNETFRTNCKYFLKEFSDCNIALSKPDSDEVKNLVKLYNIKFSSDQADRS